MAEQKIKDWRRGARATIHGYPEIKERTKEATNSDPWGPTDAQKSEIAEAAFNEENRALILKALWKRVSETGEYWMHVYKALDVLEYLLLVDIPGIFNEIRFHEQMISHLLHYAHAKHKDPKERDNLNDKVRIKAKRLLALIRDPESLASERKKLRLIMARLTGVPEPADAPTSSSSSHPHVEAVPIVPGGQMPYAHRTDPKVASVEDIEGAGTEYEIDLEILQQMMEMGFTDQDAVMEALLAADNNLDRACEYILSNPKGKKGNSPTTANAARTPLSPPSGGPKSEPVPRKEPAQPATSLFDEAGGGGGAELWAPNAATPPVPPREVALSLFEAQSSAQPTQQPSNGAEPPRPAAKPQGTVPVGGDAFDPFAEAVKENWHSTSAPAPTATTGTSAEAPPSSTPPAGPINFFQQETVPVQQQHQQQRRTSSPPDPFNSLFAEGSAAGANASANGADSVAPQTNLFADSPSPQATGQPDFAGGGGEKTATLQDKMMQEFQLMGGQTQPKKQTQSGKTLDQLMQGGH